MIHPERIAEVMGGFAILGQDVRSLQDLESSVSDGLPKVGSVAPSNVCTSTQAIFEKRCTASFPRRPSKAESAFPRGRRAGGKIGASDRRSRARMGRSR